MNTSPQRVADWAGPEPASRRNLLVVAAVGWVVLGGLGALAGAAAGIAWPLGAAAVVALLAADVATQGRRALHRVGGRPVAPGAALRLVNQVNGVATDLGVAVPRIFLYQSDAPNAFVCRAWGPGVAVSSAAMEALSRTELEALVTHCLLRLRENVHHAVLAVHLGRLARLAGPAAFPIVGPAEDSRAAAATRYPPALSAAIAKSVPASGRYAPLHFLAEPPTHAPTEERLAALAEL